MPYNTRLHNLPQRLSLTNVDRLISDSSAQHSRFAFHYCWRFRQATEHVSLFSGNEDTFLIADNMTPDSWRGKNRL